MLPFLELDPTIVKDMITVNITAATYLCHQVINCNHNDDLDYVVFSFYLRWYQRGRVLSSTLPPLVTLSQLIIECLHLRYCIKRTPAWAAFFTGSYVPGPYLAEYVATKHYMHSFTEVQISRLVRNQCVHSFADFWTPLPQDFASILSTSE